ncbi:unnamed protein product [Owenia fusiformis]|uniref:Peptidase M14 domain-containing protein n=1 Tax=Owenia fusiformis TaxID=6347 RepID=A0A8J1U7I7_OWEFU|nr:unnamed protein product [Owenia fusiformis]
MASKRSLLIILGVIGVIECLSGIVRYDGYKVLRIQPSGLDQQSAVVNLIRDGQHEIDVWSEMSGEGLDGTGSTLEIQVSPSILPTILSTLEKMGIHYDVLIDDLQKSIEEQLQANGMHRYKRSADSINLTTGYSTFHDKYWRYEEINEWLLKICKTYPNLTECINLGMSYENRPIYAIKISTSLDDATKRQAIWIDAGMHAREWIAPSVALFIIDQLIHGYSSNSNIEELLSQVDFYILPVFNVDGYVYSWTTDRLWRKTRSPNPGSKNCSGTDPNRNWDFHFYDETASGFGWTAATDPCANIYQGAEPHSEIEVRHMDDFIQAHAKHIKAYVTLHSYGTLLMWPWCFTTKQVPPTNYDLAYVALAMRGDIKNVHGRIYRTGNIGKMLGFASGGTSVDYMYNNHSIKYSYAFELPGGPFVMGQSQLKRFLLPPENIVPISEEIYVGIKTLAEHVIGGVKYNLTMTATVATTSSATNEKIGLFIHVCLILPLVLAVFRSLR